MVSVHFVACAWLIAASIFKWSDLLLLKNRQKDMEKRKYLRVETVMWKVFSYFHFVLVFLYQPDNCALKKKFHCCILCEQCKNLFHSNFFYVDSELLYGTQIKVLTAISLYCNTLHMKDKASLNKNKTHL